MVGGIVLEVCNHPTERNKIYVNCGDRPYSKVQECALYVENSKISQQIEIGDSLWWQGGVAYWTPQNNRGKSGLRCGIDFDIQIRRIGYSGVEHPVWSSDCETI